MGYLIYCYFMNLSVNSSYLITNYHLFMNAIQISFLDFLRHLGFSLYNLQNLDMTYLIHPSR